MLVFKTKRETGGRVCRGTPLTPIWVSFPIQIQNFAKFWRSAVLTLKSLSEVTTVTLALMATACASTTLYYPPEFGVNTRGDSHPIARKAIQLYGDSIGDTRIDVTRNSVHYAAAGGNDNSTTTRILADSTASVAKWTIGWGFSYGILNSFFGHAASAYSANLAAKPATVAAKPAQLPSVGSTIPAQTSAKVVAP